MKRLGFEDLERLPIVRDFLDSFDKATGVAVRIGPFPSKRQPARAKAKTLLRANVIIGGTRVATLASQPALLAREKFRALQRLLMIFAKLLSDFAERYLMANGKTDPPAVARAKDYISSRLADPVTVRDVARHVNLSADYFARSFKKTSGITLSEYVARQRVQRAKDLLAEPDTRVADVAFAAGFQSVPYFNRVFLSMTGMTPGVYRRSLSAPPKLDKKKPSHA